MELFDPKKINIDFSKYLFRLFNLSIILTVLGIISLFVPGLRYGIDFRGGLQTELTFPINAEVNESILREIFSKKIPGDINLQASVSESAKTFLLTANANDPNALPEIITAALTERFPDKSWQISKTDVVGPRIGKDLWKSAVLSIFYTCILISIFIYWRFDMRYAPGALACIFHDLIIVCAFLVLTRIEFTTTIVAALLTLAGYSVNDTVVIFDRIREIEQKSLGKNRIAIVNKAINSTLGRTFMTTITTMISCVVLYIFGGETLRPFAITLFVGILVGTYSSVFVASPLYILSDRLLNKAGSSQPAMQPR